MYSFAPIAAKDARWRDPTGLARGDSDPPLINTGAEPLCHRSGAKHTLIGSGEAQGHVQNPA